MFDLFKKKKDEKKEEKFPPKIDTFTKESKLEIKQLSKEEKPQRVEDFIKEYNIESDDDYIYLYKAVNLDGTNMYSLKNKITYEVGKIYTEQVDEDINQECSSGIHASTLDYAIDFGKGNNNTKVFGGRVFIGTTEVNNPKELKEKPNFKVFKVKIHKEHIIVPNYNHGKIRCSQMEIIEEVELKVLLKYKIKSINELPSKEFEYVFNVENIYNNSNITVKFKSNNLELTQNEIKELINQRLDIMQKIYDQYETSNGILN